MLTILFIIFLIGFIGECISFAFRASWGILKLLCMIIFFPGILIVMATLGLTYVSLSILIIAGIVALLT